MTQETNPMQTLAVAERPSIQVQAIGHVLARIRNHDLDALSFAWAGGLERGQGHYYRIHGAHFAIEYDNTQNGANHVHTVWRDFERDFGGDPLRDHLDHDHGK